ncbi:MAG: rRNA maturation RNase YbeY [Phycisphaerae bacterium]
MTASETNPETEPGGDRHRRRLTISVTGCTEELAALIRRAARRALQSQDRRRGRLEVAVVPDAEMRRLHRRWLENENTTDVLSFDLREDPHDNLVDGQLIVCRSVARRRARSRKADWRGELLLYVVHGCLHLCGWNDQDEDEATEMHRQEDKLLAELGWGAVFAPRADRAVKTGPRGGTASERKP